MPELPRDENTSVPDAGTIADIAHQVAELSRELYSVMGDELDCKMGAALEAIRARARSNTNA